MAPLAKPTSYIRHQNQKFNIYVGYLDFMGNPFDIYPVLEYVAIYVSVGGSAVMGGLFMKEFYQRRLLGGQSKVSKSSELEQMAGEIKNDREIE